MSTESPLLAPQVPLSMRRRLARRLRRLMRWLALGLFLWMMLAYVVMPYLWRQHMAGQALAEAPRVTRTGNGIPGDPVNVALVGTKDEVVKAMMAAGWRPADATTLASSLKIARASIFRSPYEKAPVSDLFLFDRKQDLAFQFPVGHDPRQRHHVRFWRAEALDADDRPLWLGAATFDRSAGLSHTTAQITHHIDAAVDVERDKLLADLQKAGVLAESWWVDDFHDVNAGRNGGGDPYRTDGRLGIGVLLPPAAAEKSEP